MCTVKITFGILPTNWFVCTITNSMKCFVNWILLNIISTLTLWLHRFNKTNQHKATLSSFWNWHNTFEYICVYITDTQMYATWYEVEKFLKSNVLVAGEWLKMEMCVRTVVLSGRTVVYLRSKSGFWADILNDLYMNVYFLTIFHIWVCTSFFHTFVGRCSKMLSFVSRL